MYRIMLADDEGIVLDSLKMIIEKHFPGQCQMETAKTGRDVIELAESFRPDIAFMDIQMPGINGIEAIREIKKSSPSVVFIILSAYDKFDYAKEAINLGVLEYVNKPFSARSITEVLEKALKAIDSRRKKRSDDLRIREKMETVTPIIENGFIYAMMFQEISMEDVENYRQLLSMKADYGCMLVLEVGDDHHGNRMTNTVGAGFRTQLNYAKVRETVKETWDCVVGSVISNKIPVFLPMKKQKMDYEERIGMIDVCRELTRKLKRATDITFRIGIGSVRRLNKSMDSYEEALKALVSSTGSVAHVDDLPIQCRYDEEYPIDLEKELFDSLESGMTEECERAAGRYFDWMLDNYDEKNLSVRLKTLEFVLYAEHTAYLNGGMTYHFTEREHYLPLVVNAKQNSDLRPWFVERFKESCRNMTTKKEEHENQLVVRAQEYIRENYHRDLSLDEVSRHMDLSPYYFSKLFKEETGGNFVEYVTSLRITKAKELLAGDGGSMKEICGAVGYSDPNYFSRIFKKNTGVTPTEYRESERT
ncbi:MAG: response regulator [Lachnospiraceae bacterium]|jgi:two-component system response regulator YesN|nr:response regulator [Lachnospiraceae bacterium]